MSDGYRAHAAELTAVAGRLDQVSDDLRTAGALLDQGAGGDLGPGGVTAAFDALTVALAGRLRDADAGAAGGAAGVRAARDGYLDTDHEAAAELRRGR